MVANALREISIAKPNERCEPDAEGDFNFFMGDTNFRFLPTFTEFIDDIDDAMKFIPKHDELTIARRQWHVFPEWHEEPITFMPTYKRDDKSNAVYINKKDQCPSYTDRILVKNNDHNSAIAYQEYGCRDQIFGSDHRPVYLRMQMNFRPEPFLDQASLYAGTT